MNSGHIRFGAAAILAVAGHAHAIDKSWNTTSGGWNTANNWFLAGVPGALDNVNLGATIAAQNATVTLNINATVASMTITDGMGLDTQNSKMTVTGDTSISGRNTVDIFTYPSRIHVENGPSATDFVTRNLTVSNEASVDMAGGTLEVQGLFQINDTSTIGHEGVINLTSNAPVAMRLDGHLYASIDGLTINQLGTGRIDLDGSVADDAEISVATWMNDGTGFSHLTINGDQLTDTFDEGFVIIEGGYLNMNLSGGWAMGPASSIKFVQTGFNHFAVVYGSQLSFAGSVTMLGTGCRGRFSNPISIQPAADFVLGHQDTLEFLGATTITGGTFTTDPDPNAPTPLSFAAPTTWNGAATFNGRGSQDADATVTGPTTITAHAFDMDGEFGFSNWTIGDHLTLNADFVDEELNGNGFDGVMTISGGVASKLSVNLASPAARWYSSNTLNLGGVMNLPTPRIDGSPLDIYAVLNITGAPQIDADLALRDSATTNFTSPTSELRTSGFTAVFQDASFAGQGSLHNTSAGSLTLFNTSNLGTTSLINDGNMQVSSLVGSSRTHRLTQSTTSSWDVQIAGNNPGTLNDLLTVTGAPSTIDGTVNVELPDTGNGPYVPLIGETFLFLDARPGVTGTFKNAPTTIIPGGTVEWSFIYTPVAVRLRADHIAWRCPADFDNDGTVDFFDYDAFVVCFEGGVCPPGKTADFDQDGTVDFFDYDAFVVAFELGC